MTKRFAKLFLLPLLVMAFALAGCTSGGSGEVAESHLSKMMKTKKIRVAVLPDNPPWSILNASGNFEGYDIDIANRLAEAMGGLKVEFVSTDGANRLPLIQTDKVDVVIASYTATNERAKSIAFTEAYAAAGPLPLYRKDNPITSYDDLAGKKVSVTRGSTNDSVMSKYFPDTEVVRFDTIADAFMAVKTGKVDALIEENPIVYEFADKNPEMEALPLDPYKPGYIAMAVQQGDQIWLNYLNNFIRDFNNSGDNAELYKKWFGRDLPKLVNY
ncbi:transporter substrate-binding domain-containing protein [Paenibacillus sp. NPDC057967]|uniref:transporter substrate-binding domain-containing protein n=1 Tax=Paenibacillus sp. NPDC057967 TaxID=3346293 RepID=UPI0036D77373